MAVHIWSVAEAKSEAVVEAESPTAGYLAAVSCWALSGGVFVAAKWAVAEMPPWTLCFWRVAIAGAVLLPFVRYDFRSMRVEIRARWLELLMIGGLGLAITQGMMYSALQFTSAINVGLILALMPMIIMILARLVLGEPMGPWQGAGTAVALAGVVVIVVKGELPALLRLQIDPGELWVLAATVCFAAYTVLLKRAKFALPRLPLLVVLLGAAATVALPLHLAELVAGRHEMLDTRGYLALAYAAIPGGALMYLLYNWSIDVLGAARAGTLMYLQMLFVPLFAWLLLGEAILPYHIAGAALIVTGVGLVLIRRPATH
jgi:drug/metabolite transporter (DMT)-like permease